MYQKRKRVAALGIILTMTLSSILSGCGSNNASEPAETKASTDAQSTEASSGQSSEDSGKIRIGVWEPLTGAMAGGGEQDLEGYKLGNKLRPTVLGKEL